MLFNMICKQYNNHREPGFDSLVSIKTLLVAPTCRLLKGDPIILSILNSKNIKTANMNRSLLAS